MILGPDVPEGPRLCSRCEKQPPRKGQRWCQPCKTAAERDARAARRALKGLGVVHRVPRSMKDDVPQTPDGPAVEQHVEPQQAEASGPSSAPIDAVAERAAGDLAAFTPFLGREGHAGRRPWMDVYLLELATTGAAVPAAMAAGKHPLDIDAALDADPVFAQEVSNAIEYFRDALEYEHLRLARRSRSPIPAIFRLKKERPQDYIERAAVAVAATVSVSAEATAHDAADFLARFLPRATPSTLEELAKLQARQALPASIDGATLPPVIEEADPAT